MFYSMSKDTKRDIAWNRTLTKILETGSVERADLTVGEYGASSRTATDVLATMESMNWIERKPVEGPKPDKWTRGEKLLATIATEQS